jgi:hypothetical protein
MVLLKEEKCVIILNVLAGYIFSSTNSRSISRTRGPFVIMFLNIDMCRSMNQTNTIDNYVKF